MGDGRTTMAAGDYDRISTTAVPGYEAMQELVAAAVASAVGPGARVLDVGCGTGSGLAALARALPGGRLVGCDPSAEMLEGARARLALFGDAVRLVHGPVEAVAPQPPFDAALCTLMLHFVGPADRRATLEAIRRRLAPGAALVLSSLERSLLPGDEEVHRAVGAAWAKGRGATPAPLAVPRPVHRASADETRALLREAGFSAEVPLFRILGASGWLARA